MRVLGNDQRPVRARQHAARQALEPDLSPHRGRQVHPSPPHPVRAQAPEREQFNPRTASDASMRRQNAKRGGSFGAFARGVGHVVGHAADVTYHASPLPATFNAFEHPSEFIGGDEARVRHQNKVQAKAFGSFAEGLTGYREIRNIRNHPISGGIALASIIPGGRLVRGSAEAIKAGMAAEEGARAAEAARAGTESFKAGKGVVGGLAGAAKKLTPSERALARSQGRKELFAHLDATLEPKIARAQKRLYDKSIKAMVRNGNARNVDEAAGKLLRVRSEGHGVPPGLHQHEALAGAKVKDLRSRLFEHFDRNLGPRQAKIHKDLFDESVRGAKAAGEHSDEATGRLAALHAHLSDLAKRHEVLHQVDRDLSEGVKAARKPDGGFTLHRDLTADRGEEGFVAAHGAFEERVPADKLTQQAVEKYTAKHRALLDSDHSLRIGAWHNPEDGHVYLDISRVHPTREGALHFGREQGQLSVFDRAAASRGDWDNAFPQTGLSAQEADQIKAGLRAHGGDSTLHQADFIEPPKSAGEVAMNAAQRAGVVIKGGFEHTGEGGLFHFTPEADVTTFPHELGHFLRRYGLNSEHESRLAEWAGAQNGVWDKDAEEKFAMGLEKMIRQGDAPNNLVEEFKRLEPAFREAYPDASRLPTVPADVAQVYKEILGHRDGPQALYYALHNSLAGRRLAMEAKRGDYRTSDQAHEHFLSADERAKEEGFGRAFPKVQRLGESETSVETGGKAGLELRRGMVGVGTQRNEQEAIREVERYRKAGNLRAAQKAALGAEHPSEALSAAGGTRAGQLEHSQFEGFHGLRDYLDELATHLVEHPHLRPYEVQNAWEAILNGIEGQVPRKFEQKLLERAFGKQAESITQQIKSGTLGEKFANIANIPRSLMASGDLSAPFRQGLVVLASHPGMFFEGFAPMLRAAKSEARFQEYVREIHSMPGYALAEKSGVSITEIGDEIGAREEQFASNMAEHLHELPGVRSTPGVKHVAKGASSIVRGSDRAYVLFLNRTRIRLFNLLTHQAAEEGWHLDDKLTSDIAKFVNSATGRGDLGALKDHAATLNTLFFSPRLLKSRLDFLNPVFYMKMEPFARQQALRAAGRLAGTLSTILLFARAAGATVVADPRNADFGKIRIGNTRLDIAGGFTQPLRLISQLYTGQIVSSQTGRLENLSTSGFGRSRMDVLSQFLENKAAPVPSVLVDLLKGSQFGGKPITLKSEVLQHMVPLLWQDVAEVVHSTGPAGLGYGALDLFGVGIQNYGAPGPKTKQDTNKLLKDSLAAGLGKPPASVQNDVQWKAKLDANTYDGMSSFDRAKAAVQLFDQRYGTHLETSVLPHLTTQGQAEALYTEVRGRLFPSLSHWQSAIDKVQRSHESEQPTPQTKTKESSAPAPIPTVTDAQDVSYHVPAGDNRQLAATHGVDAAQHTQGVPPELDSAIQRAANKYGVPAKTLEGIWRIESGSTYPNPAVNSSGYGGLFGTTKWNAGTQEQANYAAQTLRHLLDTHHGNMAAALSAYSGGGYTSVPGAGGGWHAGSGGGSQGLRTAPMASQGVSGGSQLSQAADAALQMLASGSYSPMRMLSVLSSQPLQNTMEMPGGQGHIRFQIPKYTGPVGKAARGAIALAQAFLGTPYVWGGESPKGFDCSGLLQYIYAKQGVNIARTTYDQWKEGAAVPKSQLRPGDAVFFRGSDSRGGLPGHVGIYIGHGKFIEAPHTGATVRISNLAGYPGYVGARRYASTRRRGRKAA